jgi:hypothetical protein
MSDELRPPRSRPMPTVRREQRRAHLVREIQSGRGRRVRRPLILIPAVAIVVASGAFAATRIFDGGDSGFQDFAVVDCYERPSLDAPSRNAIADIIAPPGERPGDRTPAEMCAQLWDRGELGDGRVVPPLASCVSHEEVVVFPGEPRTCTRLELRALPAGYQVAAAWVTEFIDRSAAVLEQCESPEELTSELRSVFAEYGSRLPATVTIPPLPGEECAGGYPRPVATYLALVLFAGSNVTSESCTKTTTMRHGEQVTVEQHGCRHLHAEAMRGRDEGRYFVRLMTRLSRQICAIDDPNELYVDFCNASQGSEQAVSQSHASIGPSAAGYDTVVEGAGQAPAISPKTPRSSAGSSSSGSASAAAR